ncbi:MAG TPA: DUF1326 domain-containing protein [Terriglobia bacterium]|nr:DUF1326 domain-containing protein [Terriglobia bacterium]
MRRQFRLFSVLLFAVLVWGINAGMISVFALANSSGRAAASPAWAVSGVFAEACECKPPCPCWSGKKPTEHHCHNVQVYKIEKGHYGALHLDGVVVVVAWVSPEGAIMDQSAGHSVLVALYVDHSSSKAQQEAVQTIWRHSFLMGARGGKGGLKAVGFRVADVGDDHASVIIPGTLRFDIRKGSGQPMNSPDPHVRNLHLARSIKYQYSDYGMSWNYPGKHAAFASFHAESPPLSSQRH